MQTFPVHKEYAKGPDFIQITPEHIKEQLRFAQENNIDGFIVAQDGSQPVFPNLSFLPADVVRGLTINYANIGDISAINSFHNLEVFNAGITTPPSAILLENFPKLRILNILWHKNYKSLQKAVNLIRLSLWAYKPASRNLQELASLNNLIYVTLTQAGVDTLDGIEKLGKLKELSMRNVRSLKRFFSDNRDMLAPLEDLSFSKCPNLELESIPHMASLKEIGFSQIGKKETLRRLLSKLPNLNYVGITQSELSEGNLDYFLEHTTLTRVTLDRKKHYSMTEKEINALLDKKNSRNT